MPSNATEAALHSLRIVADLSAIRVADLRTQIDISRNLLDGLDTVSARVASRLPAGSAAQRQARDATMNVGILTEIFDAADTALAGLPSPATLAPDGILFAAITQTDELHGTLSRLDADTAPKAAS